MFEVGKEWDLPVVGKQKAYLSGHDEVHSLSANYPDADIRFWMGFGDHYINVFTVLKNLGLLSEQPVKTAEGLEVVPLKVVKAVLPDPASLAPNYTGKTCIGDFVKGTKDGKDVEVFVYNVADHKEAYEEVGAQGISYTAGVPAVAAALMVAEGTWDVARMANVEELPARPFLELLGKIGLPSRVITPGGEDIAIRATPGAEKQGGALPLFALRANSPRDIFGESKGRGGISRALRRFGVSPLSWAGPSRRAGDGRCSPRGSAAGNPDARARPPRTGRRR